MAKETIGSGFYKNSVICRVSKNKICGLDSNLGSPGLKFQKSVEFASRRQCNTVVLPGRSKFYICRFQDWKFEFPFSEFPFESIIPNFKNLNKIAWQTVRTVSENKILRTGIPTQRFKSWKSSLEISEKCLIWFARVITSKLRVHGANATYLC